MLIQTNFLDEIKNKTVQIFLINGVKLDGKITMFDNYSLVLEFQNTPQLVYKHAISSIVPIVERPQTANTLTLGKKEKK
jgi:host factor-I protein